MISKYEIWLHGQAVKTLASHAGIRGSIPLGVILIPSRREIFERDFYIVFFFLMSYNKKSKIIKSVTVSQGCSAG